MQGFPGSPLTRLSAAGKDYSGCVKTIIWIPRGGKVPPPLSSNHSLGGAADSWTSGGLHCLASHSSVPCRWFCSWQPGMVHACDENSFAHWQQVWAVLWCWSLLVPRAVHGAASASPTHDPRSWREMLRARIKFRFLSKWKLCHLSRCYVLLSSKIAVIHWREEENGSSVLCSELSNTLCLQLISG